MKLTPDDLPAHLAAKKLLPVYVVSGDEPLLIEEALDAIRAAARKDGYTEREVFDIERGFDWSRVIESLGSLSLFASRKIVELRMPKGPLARAGGAKAAESTAADGDDDEPSSEPAEAKSSQDGAKLIVELMERPPQDVLLLAICGALDGKQRQSKWYTALEEAGASIHAWPIDASRWPAWLDQRLRAAGVQADPEAVRLLAERTEGNALAARQEIEKLQLLHPGETLDAEAMRAAVADSARFDVFDLNDRMLAGESEAAARTLQHLRGEGLDVLAILGPLTWGLRQWAQVQAAYAQSNDAERACQQAYVPRPRYAAYAKALPRSNVARIYGLLRQAAVVDRLAKTTGGKEQAWEELLTLVLSATGRRIVRPMAATS